MHSPLLDSISRAAIRSITAFGPQNLGNTAWAFATLSIVDIPLLNAIAVCAMRNIAEFVSQGLGNTAWVYSTLSAYAARVMEGVSF